MRSSSAFGFLLPQPMQVLSGMCLFLGKYNLPNGLRARGVE
jgi:hypothetical protein